MSLWLFKCNTTPENNDNFGDWESGFRSMKRSKSGTMRWGGPGVSNNGAAIKLAESAVVGQQFLCWQRWTGPLPASLPAGQKAAAVGIIELVRIHGGNPAHCWEFKAVEHFDPPVPLLMHRDTCGSVDEVFSNPRQLRTFTELSPQEEADFRRLCGLPNSSASGGSSAASTKSKSGAGFGTPAQNKKVERAAVELVSERLEADGWTVTSREAENLGYDLEAKKGRSIRHVEVKGVSGSAPEFIITKNEVETAKADSRWEVHVVTEALSANPRVEVIKAVKFLKEFARTPISYFARRTGK